MLSARKFRLIFMLFFFSLLTSAATTLASGFAVYTQDAEALGQANAATAHTDSPSTIFFNPALMNTLEGTRIEIGSTAISPNRRFNSDATGTDMKSEDEAHFPSSLYLTHTVTPTLSAGIGVFNPFGLGSKWPEHWEGRFITTESQLSTYTVNPVLSWQVNPRLALAAGIDYLYLDTCLKSHRMVGPLEGCQAFSGSGSAWGFNLALAIDLSPDWTLGVSYRSRFDVDIKGDLNLRVPTLPELNYKGSTQITLPSQLTAGLAWQVTPQLTVELGVRWEEWSTFDQLALKLQGAPIADPLIPRKWDNAYGFNIGARYRLSDRWALMGGYLYEINPVPEETFEPAIPDADTHIVAFGVGWQQAHWKLAAACALQMERDRDKQNAIGVPAAASGVYEAVLPMLSLSVTYRF